MRHFQYFVQDHLGLLFEIDLEGYEKDSKVQINPKIKCGICGQTFDNPLTFKKHKDKVHENSINSKKMIMSIKKPYIKCQICGLRSG